MKRAFTSGLYIGMFGLALLAAGCSTYYKVTDPASGKVYYTDDIKSDKKAGAIKFEDARNKSMVTLQNSEVKEISDDEYKAAMKASETAPADKPAQNSQPQ